MNTKNIIIATIVSLAIVGGLMAPIFANPTKVGSNEVAKVPTISADVPRIVELPFLYGQKLIKMETPTLTTNVQKDQVAEKVSPKTSLTQEPTEVKSQPKPKVAVAKTQKAIQVEEDVETYDNVPLSKDLQIKISKFAEKLEIAPTLVYAVMLQEHGGEKPDFTAVSATNDYGMMQINHGNFKWLTSDLKEKFGVTFNWKDPYDSAVAATYYLSTCRDSWDSKGLSNEELFDVTVLSYNMGVRNAVKYLKTHDANDWKYVRNVSDYKERIEKGEQIVNKPRGSES